MTNRKVNRDVIDRWVDKNGPNGVSKLASKSGVSASMISKIRTGRVPIKPLTRAALSKALSTKEDILFPLVAQGSGKSAS